MTRSTPLSLPVTAGLLLTTLMRYPVPADVPLGIVPAMVPDEVPDIVPIITGAEKFPKASDNSAIKTFPALKVPIIEKGTSTEEPGQNGLPAIGSGIIICAFTKDARASIVKLINAVVLIRRCKFFFMLWWFYEMKVNEIL